MMLTVEQASLRAGVSLATMRRWATNGHVQATKFGKVWQIEQDSVPALLRGELNDTDLDYISYWRREVQFRDVDPDMPWKDRDVLKAIGRFITILDKLTLVATGRSAGEAPEFPTVSYDEGDEVPD